MIISFVKLPKEAKEILSGYEVKDENINDEDLKKAEVIIAFPRSIDENIFLKLRISKRFNQ